MTHLGDRLTAMIDGELGHEARDRVLAHLTVCAECRAEAEAHRSLKAELGHLGGPLPSSELVRRLLGLAAPGGPMPRPMPPGAGGGATGFPGGRYAPGPFGGTSSPGPSYEPFGAAALARPLAGASRAEGRTPPAGEGTGRRLPSGLRYALVGVVSLAALALSAGFVAGGQPSADDQARQVAPPVDAYVVEHAVTVGEVPVTRSGPGGTATTVTLTDTGQ